MADVIPFKCAAPGHRHASFRVADSFPGFTTQWAVYPEDAAWQEVHLCRDCASDARQEGVRAVELTEARKILKRHEMDMAREVFFRRFVRNKQEEKQAMTA